MNIRCIEQRKPANRSEIIYNFLCQFDIAFVHYTCNIDLTIFTQNENVDGVCGTFLFKHFTQEKRLQTGTI